MVIRLRLLFFLCLFVCEAHGRRFQPPGRLFGLGRALPAKAAATAPIVAHRSVPSHSVAPLVSFFTRGGACQDSNPALFFKVGVSAVVEASAMMGFLKLGEYLTKKFPNQPKLPGDRSLSQVVAALGITMGSALFGALADGGLSAATQQVLDPNVTPGDPKWYSQLVKPWWNPPGWIFPIMWLIVCKPTQAAAVSRLMTTANVSKQQQTPWKALGLFCGHLALGDAWNKVFFGLQCTGRGAAVISVFYSALVASVRVFSATDSWAGKLLLPTLGWVSVATGLNWSIFFLNRNK